MWYHIERLWISEFIIYCLIEISILISVQIFHLGKEWNWKFLLRDLAMSVFTYGSKTEIGTSSGVFSDDLDCVEVLELALYI